MTKLFNAPFDSTPFNSFLKKLKEAIELESPFIIPR